MYHFIKKTGAKQLFVSFLSGAALPLAFAPFELSIIAVISTAILFHLWLHAGPWKAFLYGYSFGLGMFGAGVSWLYISINLFGGINPAGAVVITLFLVIFLALFPASAGVLICKFFPAGHSSRFLLLGAPAAWVFLEWSRSWLFTGFPWLSLGYSQTNTVLSSLAPLAGVFAVSWLVCLFAGLLACIFHLTHSRKKLYAISAVLFIYAACFLLDQIQWTLPESGKKQVVLIQAAIPQEIKWHPDQKQPSLDLYLTLSEPHWGSDLIIWPETAIPLFYHQAKPLLEKLLDMAGRYDTDLLTGIPIYSFEDRKFYNSVIVLMKDDLDIYHKNHLVPFGEYLPFNKWLSPVLEGLDIPISNFSSGGGAPLLRAAKLPVGISICYEDVFGEEVIRALPEARLLVNVSNDAWFGDSLAPHQHLQMAQMRARETGRYLLRSTNTGISAIINEKGRVVSRSPQFQPHALSAQVRTFQGTTPYSVTGNYPVVAALMAILIYIIGSSFIRQAQARRS